MKYSPLSLAFAFSLLVVSAHALPFIEGEISFSGEAAFNNNDLTLATSVTFGGVIVTSASDDYATAGFGFPTPASWTDFDFAPFSSVSPLWSIAVGPTASFDASSLTTHNATATNLTIGGSGVAYMGGYDPTPGNWIITGNTLGGGTFSFSATTDAAPVPDGGITLILLGLGLSTLAIGRRFVKA